MQYLSRQIRFWYSKVSHFCRATKALVRAPLQSLDVHARMQKVLAEGVQLGRFLLLLLFL